MISMVIFSYRRIRWGCDLWQRSKDWLTYIYVEAVSKVRRHFFSDWLISRLKLDKL